MRETPKLWKAWGSSLGAANSCVTRHVPPGGLKIFICEMGDEDGETRGSVRSVGQLFKIFFRLKMLVINEITWEYDFSWCKIRKQLRMNPLFFFF